MMLLTYMGLLTFRICAAIKNESTEISFTVKPRVWVLKFSIKYLSDCDLIWLVETDLKSCSSHRLRSQRIFFFLQVSATS